MSNVAYRFEGGIGYGRLHDGTVFLFDAEDFRKISDTNWYKSQEGNHIYLIAQDGCDKLHKRIMGDVPKGYEIDHISLDTLDNRKCNLRVVTHQQNQINQPLQKNNTSGVTGVRFYKARNKYVARLKFCQHDIHLGYYETVQEAVQARNVGMECLYGEFGRYNDAPPAPNWIRAKVIRICSAFAECSLSEKFYKAYAKEAS